MQDLGDLFARAEADNAQARAYYKLLRAQKQLNHVVSAVVRCSHGCLLLTVFQTPAGPAFHQPRYKLSPEMNAATSSEAGRLTNTEDNVRRWNAQGGLLASAVNFSLACDHVNAVLEKSQLTLGAPGRPTRRVYP